MRYGVLGPLEVSDGERLIEITGSKQRALLATLLLHANRIVSTDRLIEALWDGVPSDTAAKGLQVYVSQLRKQLGRECLQTKSPGYVLVVAHDEFDLDRFRGLVGDKRFHEALALWRGPPLADFSFEGFAQPEIALLEEEHMACLEERIDADLRAGLHTGLVGELEALVVEHPLRERLRGQLLLALYRSDRQAEALDAYQEARRALVDELGIEPSRQLRERHQAILRQDPALELPVKTLAEEPPGEAFVGRATELAMLIAGLDDVSAGRGRLFLVAGEPGIGKSRLAEELVAYAKGLGARVLVGRCWEAGGAPAYWPWMQSLRVLIRAMEPTALRAQMGPGAAELAHLLPELRLILPDLPEPDPVDSEGARFRLFDATTEFLRRASESRPLVLVLDDLHAADTPSLLLLQFLARELGSSRLLVLAAFRDVDPAPSEPLRAMLAEVAREPVTRRLPLVGLTEPDIAEYVVQTASEIASPELTAALRDETEGNPLFVSETVRLLALEGVRTDARGARHAMPPSIRAVIERRLGHLSEDCNRLLVLASVIGREFSLRTLARLDDSADEVELLETLDGAMDARIISGIPGSADRLRFSHGLIREVLYARLAGARRVRIHRACCAALEARYGNEPGAHLAELAHHAIAGSDPERGIRYARLAGDRALALLAYEEAVVLYHMALDCLDLANHADESVRCNILLSLGEAEIRAGDTPAAKETFVTAADMARGLGLASELGRAAAGYGGRIVWARAGEDHRLIPLLEEGLEVLPDDDFELRARLLTRLAGALRDEHSRDRRDVLSRAAVDLARQTDNLAVLAYALVGRAHAIVAPDTVTECLALGAELRDVASRSRDREQVVAAHMLRSMAYLMVGAFGQGEIELAAAASVATELRQPAQLWLVRSSEAMLALARGRLAESEVLMTEAFDLGERAMPQVAIPAYQLQRYALRDFRGDLDEVESDFRALTVAYRARPVIRCVFAHIQARRGQFTEARGALEDLGGGDFAALPFDQEWLYGMSLLAETSVLVGDVASAKSLYGLLTPWAAFNAVDVAEGFRGAISRYLGLLATMLELFDAAERHFEDALALNTQMGALPWVARTQIDCARMLLARERAGDRERARLLGDAGLATCVELGMQASTVSPP